MTPLVADPEAASCQTGQFYEVKKGDTLSSIARQCGCSITILTTVNNLTSDVIYPKQKLWIPVPYEIEQGDSLFLISRRFKTTIGDIMKMNCIKDPMSIQAGAYCSSQNVSHAGLWIVEWIDIFSTSALRCLCLCLAVTKMASEACKQADGV